MNIQKRWRFGFGTIFSLIVVYFIFLYSKEKGWALLAFASKWYLIIVGGLIALSVGTILLIMLLSLLIFFVAMLRLKSFRKKHNRHAKEYINAEYKIKD